MNLPMSEEDLAVDAKGHAYAGDKEGITLKLKGGKTVHFP